MIQEKNIEKKLVTAVEQQGGLCPKFVSPGLDGMPDRIVLMPEGVIAFAEIKAPGKRLRPLQEKRKRQLENLGFKVFCVDNIQQIGVIFDDIQTT